MSHHQPLSAALADQYSSERLQLLRAACSAPRQKQLEERLKRWRRRQAEKRYEAECRRLLQERLDLIRCVEAGEMTPADYDCLAGKVESFQAGATLKVIASSARIWAKPGAEGLHRRARARGAGRPRGRRSVRSSARSGDSGSDDSGGSSEPHPVGGAA